MFFFSMKSQLGEFFFRYCSTLDIIIYQNMIYYGGHNLMVINYKLFLKGEVEYTLYSHTSCPHHNKSSVSIPYGDKAWRKISTSTRGL